MVQALQEKLLKRPLITSVLTEEMMHVFLKMEVSSQR